MSSGRRGTKVRVESWRIVAAILYRLKSGCQWQMLPVEKFFTSEKRLTANGVYYHFNKWVKNGCFKKVWIELLKTNHKLLDLSCMQPDGSHTPAKNGGEHIGYQSRKAARTTNALFFSDNQGLPLAVATPQSGNHHDLHDVEQLFEELYHLLSEADVDLKGVFMNADSGFDAQVLREQCSEKQIEANIEVNERNQKQALSTDYVYFDDLLYKRRFVTEKMNAWIDSFKALLIRFETSVKAWMALHFIAFSVLLCRKIPNC
ncbi:IS5 family transposase [Ilyomonas limi]|uniref:IS5 family transposase n=1 Tax=Ilyomonas limi TaxID=2575867 RepID=UPI00197DB3F6|nr:IS5 family transposase [Ilyomonas limi]